MRSSSWRAAISSPSWGAKSKLSRVTALPRVSPSVIPSAANASNNSFAPPLTLWIPTTIRPDSKQTAAQPRLEFVTQRELHDARLGQQAGVGAEAGRRLRERSQE